MATTDSAAETCPFCGNPVPTGAIVCGSCHAQKGFGTNGSYVQNRNEARIGVIVGLVGMGICVLLGLLNGVVGLLVGGAFAAGIYFMIADRITNLRNGPKWYRKR